MNEKSLAVECMHRLCKHINDSLSNPDIPLSDEIMDIYQMWELREVMQGADLNGCLAHFRSYKKADGTLDLSRLANNNQGWKPRGRRGLTTG